MDGIRVVRVKTYISANEGLVRRTLDFLSFMAGAVIAGLFERRPDVVVATSPQFFSAVGGWALSALKRVPFVFELGDLWPASIAAVGAMRPGLALRLIERLELFLYRRAACVVALTEAFKANLVSRGIPPGKIAVVVNGVDLPRYAPRPRDPGLATACGIAPGDFVIGYVGTHGMAHGLANVLAAAERTAGIDRLKFLFAGPGAEREILIALARERELANAIFLPPQPKDRMPLVWSLCDVALVHLKDSPVFAEVIPSKIFEAMAMGLPILACLPAGEATRLVESEGAGLAVPPEKPAALAEAALRLMRDDALRTRLAAGALAAAPRHSREFQARAMMEALRAAMSGAGDQAAERAEALAAGDAAGAPRRRPPAY
jgi:glycosyltransferase involved in cell wall biosynthesis